eukprot:TRINITY_DN17832_c0_g1_i3.p2 TRINITY_DN17832_c0_g1~~TRINITY_DN17832_c0_g1_i3.p2  ORF type:complete len:211 (-),score=37.23 TRINITY_DN17832_c0_g1_i3:407-1039(-)
MEVQSRRLRSAAARADLQLCEEARAHGGAVTFVEQDDPHAKSTLHAAAEGNDYDTVAWLLKEGANSELLDALGRTALHGACADGSANSVRAFVQYGAQLDTPDAVENWSPLHFASAYNHVSCVQLLLAGGADANAVDKWGRTPSYIASQRGNVKVVAELVTAGCDVERSAKDGANPFDYPRSATVVAALNLGLEYNSYKLTTESPQQIES